MSLKLKKRKLKNLNVPSVAILDHDQLKEVNSGRGNTGTTIIPPQKTRIPTVEIVV